MWSQTLVAPVLGSCMLIGARLWMMAVVSFMGWDLSFIFDLSCVDSARTFRLIYHKSEYPPYS
jgi:hypothetical protein